MQTNPTPEQWADKVLDDVTVAWIEHGHSAGIEAIKAAFAERERELQEIVKYQKSKADEWRGIAAAMGYEPNAHLNVRPKEKWLIARVKRFRDEAALAVFAEREARNLSDPQRLVWKDDLAGICETLESCFEHDGPARCGPCAIKASLAKGVEPDYSLPNLPEVSRLKRKNARLVGALEDVINPMGYLKRHAEAKGSQLNGMAYQIANDPSFAKSIAKEALAALKDRT